MFWNIPYMFEEVYRHLANSENWTPTQTKVFDVLYNTNIPIIGNPWKSVADSFYGTRRAEEYRKRYGIKGGGHDPRILASLGGSAINILGSAGSTLNYVSKNLDTLYKDKSNRKRGGYR